VVENDLAGRRRRLERTFHCLTGRKGGDETRPLLIFTATSAARKRETSRTVVVGMVDGGDAVAMQKNEG
jgi:hypothetical protein